MIPTLLQTVALVGGTVHSMAPGTEPTVATVLIEDGRIAAVGQDVSVPEGAQVLDLTGLHLVPGLIDAATNHDLEHDPLYVACGVTLIRDTGNRLDVLSQKTPAARDYMPGPDLLVAGQPLDGGQGATTDAVVMRTERDAELILGRLLGELEARGLALDYLSILEGLPVPAWRAAIAVAHERGLTVWGPVPAAASLAEAVRVGQDGVLGLQALLPPGNAWHRAKPADLEPAIELLRASGTHVTPLLSAYARLLVPRAEEPDELRFMGPLYRPSWLAERERWQGATAGDEVRAATQRALALQRTAVERLWAAGVPLVPGSGAPNAWLFPGRALVDELEEWVRAGVPPGEALRLATAASAQALGVGGERGTLEPGKVADIVALGADPRASLSGLRDPELVVLRGRVLERDDLIALTEALAERQAQVLAEAAKPIPVGAPRAPAGQIVLEGHAETYAFGQRLAAERFVAVRMVDGRTAYCTRIVTPPSASETGRMAHLVQVFDGNKLQGFELAVRPILEDDELADVAEEEVVEAASLEADPTVDPRRRIFTAQGARVGDSARMSVQRRLNGQLIDNETADDPVNVIDVSEALTALIAGQHFPEGPVFALSFEGEALEPYVDRWVFSVAPEDHQLRLRTTRGWMSFWVDERGAPAAGRRRRGNATFDLVVGEVTSFGGPGLPPAPERVLVAPEGGSKDGDSPQLLEDDEEQGGDDDDNPVSGGGGGGGR